MLSKQKLMFWIEKGFNVLFSGKHGVGKSSIIIEVFNEAGLKWAYFSGATMDPFIDFVGVPVKIDDDDGGHIKLIMPEHIKPNEIEAIFIDEYNRTHKKVRNATMELIQFRSINGRPFPRLKLIWAAINPDDETDDTPVYDVEPMDPAQRDRFHVHVTIPYKPVPNYFTEKYGDEIGKAGLQWWDELPDKAKEEVSPRRLDYALRMFQDGGDIHDVLPRSSNPAHLKSLLHTGPAEDKLDAFIKNHDLAGAKSWLAVDNNFDYVRATIFKFAQYRRWFVPLMLTEKISLHMHEDSRLKWDILDDLVKRGKESVYYAMLNEIVKANVSPSLCSDIRKKMELAGLDVPPIKAIPLYQTGNVSIDYEDQLKDVVAILPSNKKTYQRRGIYKKLVKLVAPNMKAEAAYNVLNISNAVLGKSYNSTVDKSFPKIVAISNQAILSLLRDGVLVLHIERHLDGLIKLMRHRRHKNSPTVKDLDRYMKSKTSYGGTTVVVEEDRPITSIWKSL